LHFPKNINKEKRDLKKVRNIINEAMYNNVNNNKNMNISSNFDHENKLVMGSAEFLMNFIHFLLQLVKIS